MVGAQIERLLRGVAVDYALRVRGAAVQVVVAVPLCLGDDRVAAVVEGVGEPAEATVAVERLDEPAAARRKRG